jgi:hypothetical protein
MGGVTWTPPDDLKPGRLYLWAAASSSGTFHKIAVLDVVAPGTANGGAQTEVSVDKVMWNGSVIWPLPHAPVPRVVEFRNAGDGNAILVMTGFPAMDIGGIAAGIPHNSPAFFDGMEAQLAASATAGDVFWRFGYISTSDEPWSAWGTKGNSHFFTETFNKLRDTFNDILIGGKTEPHVSDGDSDWFLGQENVLKAGDFVSVGPPVQVAGFRLPGSWQTFRQQCVDNGYAAAPDDIPNGGTWVFFYKKEVVGP